VPWHTAVAVGQLIRVVLAASRGPAEADGFARGVLQVQAAYLKRAIANRVGIPDEARAPESVQGSTMPA
jgi:hypothetical protein